LSDLTDHALQNRGVWSVYAADYVEPGRRCWSGEREPSWGIWGVPEAELRALPDVAGKDAVEFGCGTAYWSAWLARMGARPVGVDVTPAQLETARRFQHEYGLEFPLVEASAESVPLPDASFDLALSEYGASIWCDPYLWIPEAARLLRPGGELVFLVNGTIQVLCWPDEEAPPGTQLLRPYFGMHRFEWTGDEEINFFLGYGDWLRLLRQSGFEVLDLIEIQAPADAKPHRHEGLAGADWARRWPSEEIWRARKR
jgi:SAM-dependent methyltransferase